MLTRAQFLDAYPEFRTMVPKFEGAVDAALAEEALFISSAWGSRQNTVHGLRVAHNLISRSPGADTTKLDENWDSEYSRRLKAMYGGHAAARMRVVG